MLLRGPGEEDAVLADDLKNIPPEANIQAQSPVVGGPGVKPGFAASDAAVLFGYTTHPLELAPGIQSGSLDLTNKVRTEASSCLRPREPN